MKYDKMINEFQKENKKVKINNFYLTEYQIRILRKYQIPYENCHSIKEILFYIEEILETEEYEDLENVSASLGEVDYYQNYNK